MNSEELIEILKRHPGVTILVSSPDEIVDVEKVFWDNFGEGPSLVIEGKWGME